MKKIIISCLKILKIRQGITFFLPHPVHCPVLHIVTHSTLLRIIITYYNMQMQYTLYRLSYSKQVHLTS